MSPTGPYVASAARELCGIFNMENAELTPGEYEWSCQFGWNAKTRVLGSRPARCLHVECASRTYCQIVSGRNASFRG